ncbi:MAG: DUF1573 domain-containing protein [Bacteroidota bacterium]|nr:DUF1573 domain-containing protein [Bacteroidota bacterium]MDP4218584.1 DUF1573 domain-containing protein [Bacteroidota bacterium]MDP4260860.1 DUF1573 domain-containing protein [Bacteroidota bacterium]
MRTLIVSFALTAMIAGCRNNDKTAGNDKLGGSGASGNTSGMAAVVDSSQFTNIEWLDSAKDFGSIQEGQKLEVTFRFKNSGDKPLVISQVRPSCGCTVAEQPKDPVPPGGEGLIKAIFNSEGHVGPNHKTLYVSANARNLSNNPLRFSVQVEKKK